jgi:Ca2+-binding RTX toxin-like protein
MAYAYELVEPPASAESRAALSADFTQYAEFGNLRAEIRPLYTTFDDPSFHIVGSGGPLTGVGDLLIVTDAGTFRCSGALLPSGIHVLTAAHCITNGAGVVTATSATVRFERSVGPEIISVSTFTKHPSWNGDFLRGNDVAILTLSSPASPDVPRYDIDRNGADDVGTIVDKAGYGRSGTGITGDTLSSGTKRDGVNLYDALGDTMLVALGRTPGGGGSTGFVPGSQLQYDFDNGNTLNDAFDFFFNISELGQLPDEVMSAPGDSGGPSLTNKMITGITSYGISLEFTSGPPPLTSDINSILDSSFGEFAGDTRVSLYASFIDSIVPSQPTFCGRNASEFATIFTGTDGVDTLSGTQGDDVFDGKKGDDSFKGNGGNDCIMGGEGNDRLSGGLGDDYILGGPGNDSIQGGPGNDYMEGGTGTDKMSGGDNNDEVRGGYGLDHLTGRAGDDMLFGNAANDILSGGTEIDTCNGGPGVNTATGSCETIS